MMIVLINYSLDYVATYFFLTLIILILFFYLNSLFNLIYLKNNINNEKQTANIKTNKKENINKKDINKDDVKTDIKSTKKEKQDDDFEMTKEQEQELWAETYYTKPKNLKKEKEPYKPLSKQTKKLLKIFYWFFFLNFITLIIAFFSTFIVEPGLVNINLTTKAFFDTPEYTTNVINLLKYSLDDFYVSNVGKRFLEEVKNMIDAETLTPEDIVIFIDSWKVKEEGPLAQYKILWCLLEYFINHYKESSIDDRGHIRLIIKLCYAYCTELKLIHNQFDLIRLLRFIYRFKNPEQ